MTAATLSFTSSFFAFSAKVGQSLAPSSWMNLILRPSTPPVALICSIASFSAWIEPVSLIAMVPVTECRMADRDFGVGDREPGGVDLPRSGNFCASALGASSAVADSAAAPVQKLAPRRVEEIETTFV